MKTRLFGISLFAMLAACGGQQAGLPATSDQRLSAARSPQQQLAAPSGQLRLMADRSELRA